MRVVFYGETRLPAGRTAQPKNKMKKNDDDDDDDELVVRDHTAELTLSRTIVVVP